ncbi:protein MRP-126-like [Alca torda]
MKTDLELALECAINIYHQYAVRQPIDDYLSKNEFSELLKENAKPFLHNTVPLLIEKQLVNYLKHVRNKATIDQIMKDLDTNGDAQICFSEMMLLITRVTIATHEHLHDIEDHQQQQQQQQQKHQHHH